MEEKDYKKIIDDLSKQLRNLKMVIYISTIAIFITMILIYIDVIVPLHRLYNLVK